MARYVIDEFSPFEDPDEEAARRRAEATGRPAIAAPAADVETPALGATPITPNAGGDAGGGMEVVRPGWGDTVRRTTASQERLAGNATSAIDNFRARQAAIQQRKDALLQQRQTAAQPIAYRDASGQVLEQYKPSLTQRILRGVGALSRGGVLATANPQTVGLPGYSDPNSRYMRDVGAQQAQVAALDAGIAASDKDSKDAFDMAKGLSGEYRANATILKDAAQGAINAQDADTKAAEVPIRQTTAQAELLSAQSRTPEAVARTKQLVSQAEYDGLVKQANALGLKGASRLRFLAGQKAFADPRNATPEEIQYGQALRAWRQENPGKEPTVNDLNGIHQAVAGRMGGGGTGNATGVVGDLSGVPENLRATVQAIGEGRQTPNTRNKDGMAIMNYVNQVYPGYDMARARAYQDARVRFTSGKQADGIKGARQALHHLNTLESKFPKDNDPLTFDNWVRNTVNSTFGGTRDTGFNTALGPVTQEVEKAYKGGAITEAEGKAALAKFNANMGPAKFKEAVKSLRELLGGSIDSYRKEYEGSRPPGMPDDLFELPNMKDVEGAAGMSGGAPASSGGGFNWDAHPKVQ